MFTPAKHTPSATAVEEYLHAFAATSGHLDFARFGPPSLGVGAAAAGFWSAAAEGDVDEAAEDLRARERVACLVGVPATDVSLVPSTSLGLFHVAFALRGGEVLVSRGEFPANLYPWWRAEELGILRVRDLPAAQLTAPVTPERIADALAPTTTAVAVSAVDFRTGWRADLAGIRGVIGDRLLVVDAIQAAGAVDMPFEHADVVIAGGQKWLRAGWGTGFVTVSPRALAAMSPRLSGWTGVERPGEYDGTRHPALAGAKHLGLTNGSPASARMLAAALELIGSVGVGLIEQRISERVEALIAHLDAAGAEVVSPRPPADRAGIVVARWGDGSAGERRRRLAAHGVTVTVHGDDRLRFSLHATTELDGLGAVAELASAPL
ncbi:aminotransferase class V-fold PLP-dependent enzyme [Microbacterium hibisci]|uniref:aminotransferase class V-fold PLP-dependent enzyme n=1 Tax=Microbacterium hibisci TaxID=2036000 RepID=UPI0019403C86|nr:aminotransferase class V-fold PLP-dependent enzyme [Microbacterium hibisci]